MSQRQKKIIDFEHEQKKTHQLVPFFFIFEINKFFRRNCSTLSSSDKNLIEKTTKYSLLSQLYYSNGNIY